LAVYVSKHPITWKETRDQAEALLKYLSDSIPEGALQAGYDTLQGRDIRELTSEWMTDYEAG
jgi:hypothetical protein